MLSTLIMLPLGISLTRRATRDRSLFEFDSYLEPIKKFLKIKPKEIFDTDGNDISYNYFEGYTNDKLMDIIKHPEAFDYSPYCKAKAFAILSKRSVSFKTLSENGICVDENLISAAPKAKDVVEYSNFAMIFYIAATILIILHFVFKNNKMPELAAISIDLGLIALFVFLLYFVVTLVTSIKFYKHLTLKVKPVNMLLMLLGLPFYGVSHFLLKNKINEDLNSSAIDSLK
ncbi:MAG TPA: hypothetical protein PKI08_10900 [Aquaticitalea sp.]|nr:hypothetical protein [Aquaticitalea sp.]